jgi:CheY-like chemotaxis protein
MAEERQPRVLVIDDNASIREVVRSLLASFGYDCQTAADGAQGLARFDEGGWDLVLTDLAMPEMNGWEVAEAIRQRSSTIPIVLITGLTDPEVVRRRWRATLAGRPEALSGGDAEGRRGHRASDVSPHRTEPMTRAALAEERRDEIDEWREGGFLGAVAMTSAREERVRFAFRQDCRRAATRNSFGSSTLDRSSPVSWGRLRLPQALGQLPRVGTACGDSPTRIAGQREA